MEIIDKLRKILLPVFGLNSIDEIKPESSLVNDLGADSIDFVEIVYLIERNFGIVLNTNEIIIGGVTINSEKLFIEGKLTKKGADLLNKNSPGRYTKFRTDMSRIELFSSITVKDLAQIIIIKSKKGVKNV